MTWPQKQPIYTTQDGVVIYAEQGSKTPNDFIIRYQEPNRRIRTPKHIHVIVDLYMKLTGNHAITMQLVDHILDNIISKVSPSNTNPPAIQIYSPQTVQQFQTLDGFGVYSVEFVLYVTEMIMIQEKTNYPNGTLTDKLFRKFRHHSNDLFAIISAATYR